MKKTRPPYWTGPILVSFALGILFTATILFLLAPIQAIESYTVNPPLEIHPGHPLSSAIAPADMPDRAFQAQWNGRFHSPAISRNSRYVAFCSDCDTLVADDTNGASDIFVRDLQTGRLERVSVSTQGIEAHGLSTDPFISANGRYVVFQSEADNLCPCDRDKGCDIFVHDRRSGKTRCISSRQERTNANGALYLPGL